MTNPDEIKINDDVKLRPKTTYREPVLEFDFPGLKIGIGEYEEGPTGCTVFRFDERVNMVSDVRGGSPGVVGEKIESVDAIVFTGGSFLGFESFTGVNAEIVKERHYKVEWETIPLIAGAVIWDLGMVRPNNLVHPDKALGRAGYSSAKENNFPLGNQGAGISATVGKFLNFSLHQKGGQGGAFGQYGDVKILVFCVVNALGAIKNREGKIVRGSFTQETGEFLDITETIKSYSESKNPEYKGNTTLTLVTTNQKFTSRREFQQVARQIHVSMARAIHPFHHLDDGDILFLTTTGEVFDGQLTSGAFGVLAGELAWDAVLTCFE
ncbi:MAG: P1 family peptidase [Candidatus Hodarchaeales archaeon]|jgi:L-aminopeptidase/D-esterase-like protein